MHAEIIIFFHIDIITKVNFLPVLCEAEFTLRIHIMHTCTVKHQHNIVIKRYFPHQIPRNGRQLPSPTCVVLVHNMHADPMDSKTTPIDLQHHAIHHRQYITVQVSVNMQLLLSIVLEQAHETVQSHGYMNKQKQSCCTFDIVVLRILPLYICRYTCTYVVVYMY